MYKFLTKLDKLVDRVTIFFVVLTMAVLLVSSITGIVLRWTNTPLVWIEPFVRHLVFLLAFLGGIIAAGRNAHISIDILGRYFEAFHNKKIKMRFDRLIYFISFFAVVWLTDSAYGFYVVELQYGKEVFLGIHSGFLVGIIPVGFSLIAFRFFYKFVNSFSIFHDGEAI